MSGRGFKAKLGCGFIELPFHDEAEHFLTF